MMTSGGSAATPSSPSTPSWAAAASRTTWRPAGRIPLALAQPGVPQLADPLDPDHLAQLGQVDRRRFQPLRAGAEGVLEPLADQSEQDGDANRRRHRRIARQVHAQQLATTAGRWSETRSSAGRFFGGGAATTEPQKLADLVPVDVLTQVNTATRSARSKVRPSPKRCDSSTGRPRWRGRRVNMLGVTDDEWELVMNSALSVAGCGLPAGLHLRPAWHAAVRRRNGCRPVSAPSSGRGARGANALGRYHGWGVRLCDR